MTLSSDRLPDQVAARRLTDEFRADTGTTANRIEGALMAAIINGGLAPNTRLGEGHLSALFDVSRTPVREALFRLEADGLVERDRTGGARVARIDSRQIIEVYAVREALDGVAARLAAAQSPGLEVRKLRLLNDAMRAAAERGRLEDMADVNIDFHHSVALASGNAMLADFVARIHRYVRRFGTTTFSVGHRATEAVREHDAIVDAIAAGDPDRAEEVARRHMRAALDVRIQIEAETAVGR